MVRSKRDASVGTAMIKEMCFICSFQEMKFYEKLNIAAVRSDEVEQGGDRVGTCFFRFFCYNKAARFACSIYSSSLS